VTATHIVFKLFGKVGCIPEPPEAIVRTCKDFNATWAFPNGSGGNGKILRFILALLVAVEAVVLSIRKLWRAGNDGSMQFADMSKLAIVAIPTRSICKVSAGFQTGARIIAFADRSSAGASNCAPTLVVVVVVVEAPTLVVVKSTTTLVVTVVVIVGVVDVTASTSASSTTTTASASSKCIILWWRLEIGDCFVGWVSFHCVRATSTGIL
jgi:hypothetical protein